MRSLSEALGEGVRAGLHKLHLGFDDIRVYATPRRLAVLVLRLALPRNRIRWKNGADRR